MSETQWTRWADEGGVQIRFELQANGAVKVSILESDGQVPTATLANFRVAQLPDWIQPKAASLEASLAEVKEEVAVQKGLVIVARILTNQAEQQLAEVKADRDRLQRVVEVVSLARDDAEVLQARAEAQVKELSEALSDLYDEQNGPPLIRSAADWQAAMDKAAIAGNYANAVISTYTPGDGRHFILTDGAWEECSLVKPLDDEGANQHTINDVVGMTPERPALTAWARCQVLIQRIHQHVSQLNKLHPRRKFH